MKLQKLALAAAMTAASFAASAADLPARNKAPMMAAPAPVLSWTGAYVGANAGYAFWNNIEVAPNGAVVGLRAGYDYQISPNVVLGALIDGDIGFGRKSETITAAGVTARVTAKHKYDFSVDVRAGYLLSPNGLLYVVAGYTHGQLEASAAVAALSEKVNGNGFNVGAGYEHRLTQNVSAFGEYRFNRIYKDGAHSDANLFKLGVNYRF